MKQYSIKKTLYRVRDFISWQKNNALEISPSFQRRPVWNNISKSYLIDTIVRGLPVPIIFLREKITSPNQLEPIREVVDGQQRLRTIFSFISTSILKDYDPVRDEFLVRKSHNKDIAGLKFNELDDHYKKAILEYEFSVHVLPSDVDDREILQIFARMNSTGVKLNNQELRNAEFVGEFKDSVYQSAVMQFYNWKKWNIFSDVNISRMYEVEFVSEIYQLMLEGIKGKQQTSLNNLYEKNEEQFKERKFIEERFEHVIKLIDDNFSDLSTTIFRNPSYFYQLFAFLYDSVYGLNSPLLKATGTKIPASTYTKLMKISTLVEDGKSPTKIQELIDGRRLNTLKFRSEFFKYIKQACR